MSKKPELIDAVIRAARDTGGGKKLPCAEALRLAEQFGVEKLQIGQICNARRIRLCNCQLGCFK